jgi:branched-chain amino acid transport system permease protein
MLGPILGTFFLLILPEALEVLKEFRPVILGAILILTIIFLPAGLLPGIQTVWANLVSLRKGSHNEPVGNAKHK